MIKRTSPFLLGFTLILLFLVSCSSGSGKKPVYSAAVSLPDIEMPGNQLPFKTIEGYENYRIVATHYRTDKKELRYVLANAIAFKALKYKRFPLPQGSKVVKIGWKTHPMKRFGVALEAGSIQRVEFMIKDSSRFSGNPGSWGYARFVKKNGQYKAWQNGTNSCISCHNGASNGHDFLFTQYQEIF